MAKGEEKWCAKSMQVTFVLEVPLACLVCITFVEANIGAWRKIHFLFNFRNLGHLYYFLRKFVGFYVLLMLCALYHQFSRLHATWMTSSIYVESIEKFSGINQSPITFCSMTNNGWLKVVNIHHNIKRNTLFP
jgi:hypothetical protein